MYQLLFQHHHQMHLIQIEYMYFLVFAILRKNIYIYYKYVSSLIEYVALVQSIYISALL